MEQTPRAQPFFKDPRGVLTSASVTREVRLSELLLVTMLPVLSKSSSAWGGVQFSSCWKYLAQ